MASQDTGYNTNNSFYDWICSNCNYKIFGSNEHCKHCGLRNPQLPDNLHSQYIRKLSTVVSKQHYKDWQCDNCNMKIFGSKDKCKKCNSSNPKILK
jgi:hypothetical protein